MKKTLMFAGLLSGACIVGAAQAATLDVTMIVTQDNPGGTNFLGQTGSLTLTWDENDISAAQTALVAEPTPFLPGLPAGPGFDFEITDFFGLAQTFSDSDDPNAILEFAPNNDPLNPVQFILSISEDEPGANVPIDDARILGFSTFGTFQSTGVGTASINVRINDLVAPVPVPASALLLGSGLLGAAAFMKKRRRRQS